MNDEFNKRNSYSSSLFALNFIILTLGESIEINNKGSSTRLQLTKFNEKLM